MKKLIAAALIALGFAAHADVADWTVTATDTDYKYIVLPATVAASNTGDEWYAAVNILKNDTFLGRVRVHVNGCPVGRGQTAWFDAAGDAVVKQSDWQYQGDRVRDMLAHKVCTAAYGKNLFRTENETRQSGKQQTM